LVRIVKNLGSFAADQASTIEVAVVVEGIKGEVGSACSSWCVGSWHNVT
jgi:hypothetical protein